MSAYRCFAHIALDGAVSALGLGHWPALLLRLCVVQTHVRCLPTTSIRPSLTPSWTVSSCTPRQPCDQSRPLFLRSSPNGMSLEIGWELWWCCWSLQEGNLEHRTQGTISFVPKCSNFSTTCLSGLMSWAGGIWIKAEFSSNLSSYGFFLDGVWWNGLYEDFGLGIFLL